MLVPWRTIQSAVALAVLLRIVCTTAPSPVACQTEQVVSSKAKGLACSPWPRFRGDAHNTGRSSVRAEGKVVPWSYQTIAVNSGCNLALGADGTVYAPLDSLYAFDGTTGKKRWEFHAPGPAADVSLGSDNVPYVGAASGRQDKSYMYAALDLRTGKPKWTALISDYVPGPPCIGADGSLYAVTLRGIAVALDTRNGAEKWHVDTGLRCQGACALGPDGTLYFSSPQRVIYALDTATRKEKWRYETRSVVVASPTLGEDGTLYIQMTYDQADVRQGGYLVALDTASGHLKWDLRMEVSGSEVVCLAPDGMLYISLWRGAICAVDSRTGHQRWIRKFPHNVHACTLGSGGSVYCFTDDGSLWALNSKTSTVLWTHDFGCDVRTPPIVANGLIYFMARDGRVYAVSERDGAPGPNVSPLG